MKTVMPDTPRNEKILNFSILLSMVMGNCMMATTTKTIYSLVKKESRVYWLLIVSSSSFLTVVLKKMRSKIPAFFYIYMCRNCHSSMLRIQLLCMPCEGACGA